MRGSALTTTNKQAGTHGSAALEVADAEIWIEKLARWQGDGERLYQEGLRIGIPKELARGAMSVFRYSTMRASANLRGWLHLFGLRMAKNAQEEFRVYAQAAGTQLIATLFPRTWQLFAEKLAP